jgi:hypothetical protein
MIFNMKLYFFLVIRSPRCLKLNLYVRTTPQRSSSHMPKYSFLWGSFTKRLYSLNNGIHNNFQILFFQNFLFTYDTSTSLDSSNNMKLLNANYEPKAPIFTLYILKEKNEWIVNHIHSHLFPMHQTNHHISLITFHPSMDKFYVIWSLRFGRVYILTSHYY